MVNIFGRLLQGNDVPPSCNLLFEGIFFSPTGSRVPVVDAESPLHNRTGRKAFTRTCFLSDASRNSAVAFSMSPYAVPGFRGRSVWPMK